jgi:hypothetical protein
MKGTLAMFFGLIATASLALSQITVSYSSLILVNQEQADESQIPIKDYSARESKDAADRAKRREKSRRYSYGGKIKEEQRISVFTSSESSVERLPSLPVALSDAVVVSEITNAQAHLSDDKSGIYSEFTVRLEEVLKSNGEPSLSPGAAVIAEREGGAVRFPSGHVQRYIVSGEQMPKVGKRYLLFLKRNDSGQDFLLLKGYELRAGRVFPMDNFRRDAVYKGFDQDAFINVVRSAISNSSQISLGKVR